MYIRDFAAYMNNGTLLKQSAYLRFNWKRALSYINSNTHIHIYTCIFIFSFSMSIIELSMQSKGFAEYITEYIT